MQIRTQNMRPSRFKTKQYINLSKHRSWNTTSLKMSTKDSQISLGFAIISTTFLMDTSTRDDCLSRKGYACQTVEIQSSKHKVLVSLSHLPWIFLESHKKKKGKKKIIIAKKKFISAPLRMIWQHKEISWTMANLRLFPPSASSLQAVGRCQHSWLFASQLTGRFPTHSDPFHRHQLHNQLMVMNHSPQLSALYLVIFEKYM